MKRIINEIISKGEVSYNIEIIGVTLPGSGGGDFELLLAVWPDLWNFQGPKSVVSIYASGARLLEEIDAGEIEGYELRDILVDEDAKHLDIYVTLRIIKLSYENYSIRKL